jgi:hypothetical protein
MFALLHHRTLRIAALLLATGIPLAACDDDPVEAEPEPEVATLRLTVGTQVVTVNVESGTVTGGPITLPVGARTVQAEFLRADGTPDPIVTATAFRLDVTPTSTAVVTFARTSAFSGTLTGLQSGQSTPVAFALFHLEEQHNEFSRPVTVQVQ